MAGNAPVRDYKKIVIFGATGTIGQAVVAELLPEYEVLKVGNRQGQFKADLVDIEGRKSGEVIKVSLPRACPREDESSAISK